MDPVVTIRSNAVENDGANGHFRLAALMIGSGCGEMSAPSIGVGAVVTRIAVGTPSEHDASVTVANKAAIVLMEHLAIPSAATSST